MYLFLFLHHLKQNDSICVIIQFMAQWMRLKMFAGQSPRMTTNCGTQKFGPHVHRFVKSSSRAQMHFHESYIS